MCSFSLARNFIVEWHSLGCNTAHQTCHTKRHISSLPMFNYNLIKRMHTDCRPNADTYSSGVCLKCVISPFFLIINFGRTLFFYFVSKTHFNYVAWICQLRVLQFNVYKTLIRCWHFGWLPATRNWNVDTRHWPQLNRIESIFARAKMTNVIISCIHAQEKKGKKHVTTAKTCNSEKKIFMYRQMR